MTREEAIKILDPKMCRDALMEYMGGVWDQTQALEMIGEAQKMGLSALRTQADTPPNDPITPAELREMVGDPVWVVTVRLSEWCIVHSFHSADVIGGGIIMTRRTAEKRIYQYADYGKTWMAYRRKPDTPFGRKE